MGNLGEGGHKEFQSAVTVVTGEPPTVPKAFNPSIDAFLLSLSAAKLILQMQGKPCLQVFFPV